MPRVIFAEVSSFNSRSTSSSRRRRRNNFRCHSTAAAAAAATAVDSTNAAINGYTSNRISQGSHRDGGGITSTATSPDTSAATTPSKGKGGLQPDVDAGVNDVNVNADANVDAGVVDRDVNLDLRGKKKDNKKSLSVFDFSDGENEIEIELEQMEKKQKSQQQEKEERQKEEKEATDRITNVASGVNDNDNGSGSGSEDRSDGDRILNVNPKESDAEYKVTDEDDGTNNKSSTDRNRSRSRDYNHNDIDPHSSSSPSSVCEIETIKCSIDYHQRQLVYYQKKLDQLLALQGGISDDYNTKGHGHGNDKSNKKVEKDSETKGPSICTAFNNNNNNNNSSSNENVSYKSHGDDRKINDRAENRIKDYNPEKKLNNDSINRRSKLESEPASVAASSLPGQAQAQSSQSLSPSKPISKQEYSLAFDVQEIPPLRPFYNERIVYNYYQKRGLEIPQSQPQPQQIQKQKQKQLVQCSRIGSASTHMNTAADASTATATDAACVSSRKQFYDKNAASKKHKDTQQQTTKNTTTAKKGLKRKVSQPPGDEMMNQDYDISDETNAMDVANVAKATSATNSNSTASKNVDSDRSSPFSTIIKTYYANKKSKMNGHTNSTKNTAATNTATHYGNSQVDLKRGKGKGKDKSNSKNNNNSRSDKRCGSNLGSSPFSSSSSFHTCFSSTRTPSRDGSCSSASSSNNNNNTNNNRQDHYQWSTPAPAAPPPSSFSPVIHDQRSVDITKRLWEEQVLYHKRQQQRQQLEEMALRNYNNNYNYNYNKSIDNDEDDVFQDCQGTLGWSPEKHQQKRQCPEGSNKKNTNRKSLYDVRWSPIPDASTDNSSKQSYKNVVDDDGCDNAATNTTAAATTPTNNDEIYPTILSHGHGNNTSRNSIGDKNNMGFSTGGITSMHSSSMAAPMTQKNVERSRPKNTKAYIYILSSDSDENSDYGM